MNAGRPFARLPRCMLLQLSRALFAALLLLASAAAPADRMDTPAAGCAMPVPATGAAGGGALPAPRIINLAGSVPIVTMEPFAEFLIGMGYPETSLRAPHDGSLSTSSYTSSEQLAGTIAWYYERDGMRPMLIGHSQGGMLVVRTLHELAGAFQDEIQVYDPVANAVLPRTAIRDPYTHAQRPVVGLEVSFAAALATGALPRLLLGQWTMLPKLRKIPDTALDFTGFTVAWDPIAGNFGTGTPYVPLGTANVRNITLPATYSHIGLPITEHLAANPVTRAWIDAYRPDAVPPVPQEPDVDVRNLLHAADLWFSIRAHWCNEGQRRRAAEGSS
jgi:hypothetical protein